jgi:hypothetical protein
MATPPPDPPAPWKRWWPPRSPRAICKTPSARLGLVAPVGFPAEWEQWPGTVRDTLPAAHPRAVVSADHRGCDLQRLRRPHKGQPGRPYRPDVPASAALRPGPHGRVLQRCGVLRCAVLLPALARVEDWIRLLPPPPPRCRAGLFDSDSGVTFYPGTFRCPRCRAGLFDGRTHGNGSSTSVSMPSVSGGTFRPTFVHHVVPRRPRRFYALGVGRDFSTAGWDGLNANSNSFYALGVGRDFSTSGDFQRWDFSGMFLCPRCRAGLFDSQASASRTCHSRCFYALDVGRDFSTYTATNSGVMGSDKFLCPRWRAGLFDGSGQLSSWRWQAFLCPRCRAGLFDRSSAPPDASRRRWDVSMPSMSGGTFRRMRF